MTKHIDKIVPLSAVIMSIFFAFSAYHLASANSLLPSQKKQIQIQDELSKSALNESKPKILIVPGHDHLEGGAIFNDLTESELNLQLSEKIKNKLSDNYEIYISRDENGYASEFLEYFDNYKEEITSFIYFHKNVTKKLIEEKSFEPNQKIKHNKATKEMAFRLYGINKWANENEIDLVIHIHFNNYPRENMDTPGKYKGFSIYVPEKQLENSKKSFEFAKKLKEKLELDFSPSNLKAEEEIIIESQSLISIGANGTLKAPSTLIEYAYIYEDFLQTESSREEALDKMTQHTAGAIENYFILETSS